MVRTREQSPFELFGCWSHLQFL